jgi:hypothetical protein
MTVKVINRLIVWHTAPAINIFNTKFDIPIRYMSMDEDLYSDEVMPSKLQYVTPRSRDTSDKRKQALSFCLNDLTI